MRMKSTIAAAAFAGSLCAMIAVDAATAADLAVSTNAPTTFVLTTLIPMFEKSTGNKVALSYDGAGAMQAKVNGASPPDLVIAGPEPIDALIKEGKIAGGRVDLFISGVGLAVKAGAPKPDISSPDALKKTLLAAKSVAHSRAQSGNYFLSVLGRLGIADQMKGKLVVVQGGPVGAAAAKGDAEIAVQQVTELMPVAGVDVVGPLPPELQAHIVFSAAIPAGAKQPEAAKALIAFFESPQAAQVIKEKGLQPAAH
jgi:molybdate transport system substrate-binding protein